MAYRRATFGSMRAATSFGLQGVGLTLRGGLAWRRAFGDVTPIATLVFAGSNPFSVAGVLIVKNAALVEVGLNLAIGWHATLGVSGTGQLAEDTQDHAFKDVLQCSAEATAQTISPH